MKKSWLRHCFQMMVNTKTTLKYVMKIFDGVITMWKFRECVEDKRNYRYRDQEAKKLHGKAKVTITA